MGNSRRRLARAALVSNGMVWFGLAVFFLTWAIEQTPAAFAGPLPRLLGWMLLVAVALGLAIAGVVENRNIRSGKTSRPHR